MKPPSSASTNPDSAYAFMRQKLHGLPWLALLKRFRFLVLAAVGALLVAAFWPSTPPSNEEVWAYRVGYGMGQAVRSHGGTGEPDDIAAAMGDMRAGESRMFQAGFEDGRNGRSAEYSAPRSYERVEQPLFPFSGELAKEFADAHGLKDPPEQDKPIHSSKKSTTPAASDYGMNKLFGSEPYEEPADGDE